MFPRNPNRGLRHPERLGLLQPPTLIADLSKLPGGKGQYLAPAAELLFSPSP